jgi:hypothetical protein
MQAGRQCTCTSILMCAAQGAEQRTPAPVTQTPLDTRTYALSHKHSRRRTCVGDLPPCSCPTMRIKSTSVPTAARRPSVKEAPRGPLGVLSLLYFPVSRPWHSGLHSGRGGWGVGGGAVTRAPTPALPAGGKSALSHSGELRWAHHGPSALPTEGGACAAPTGGRTAPVGDDRGS